MQLSDHIQAKNICLALFHARSHIEHCLSNGARAINRVFNTQAVCHFMEHRVCEEGIECDVAALRLIDQHVGYGLNNLVELRLHCILQLQAPRATRQLHDFVVGKIDRNCFAARVAVTSVVDDIVSVQIRIGTRRFPFVFVGDGEAFLQRWQKLCETTQAVAPLKILDQDVSLVASTKAEKRIFVGFDRSDNNIDLIVANVHPEHVTNLKFITNQRRCSQFEVARKIGTFSKLCRFPKEVCGRFEFLGVLDMVWNEYQATFGVAADE